MFQILVRVSEIIEVSRIYGVPDFWPLVQNFTGLDPIMHENRGFWRFPSIPIHNFSKARGIELEIAALDAGDSVGHIFTFWLFYAAYMTKILSLLIRASRLANFR